jgi:sugar phosphate isomerase/epimerase
MTSIRIAISGTELDPAEPIDELIDCARDLGIAFVELWWPRNTEREGLEHTLDRIASSGIQIACVCDGSELYRDGGSVEDQQLLSRSIELAAKVGAPCANTYFGHYPVLDDSRAIECYSRLLAPCLEAACRSNVTVVLENEFNAFGVDPAGSDITRRPSVLRRLFEEVNNRWFRLNFDPCNFYCAGVEPYPYAYEVLKPYIGYCHVKDGGVMDSMLDAENPMTGWRRFTDNERQFVMRPLGQGAIPWATLIARLRDDGYNGFLTLEPHAEKPLRRTAWEQSADFVRRVL